MNEKVEPRYRILRKGWNEWEMQWKCNGYEGYEENEENEWKMKKMKEYKELRN